MNKTIGLLLMPLEVVARQDSVGYSICWTVTNLAT